MGAPITTSTTARRITRTLNRMRGGGGQAIFRANGTGEWWSARSSGFGPHEIVMQVPQHRITEREVQEHLDQLPVYYLVLSDGSESDGDAEYGIAYKGEEGAWVWMHGLGTTDRKTALVMIRKLGYFSSAAYGGLYGDSRDDSYRLDRK